MARVAERHELSPREVEILGFAAKGYTYLDTALELGIAPDTVRTHTQHIREKLGARSLAQAVAIGFRLKVLS